MSAKVNGCTMSNYKCKNNIVLAIDICMIIISFIISLCVRYTLLVKTLGSVLVASTYIVYFAIAVVAYGLLFVLKNPTRLDKQSAKEVIYRCCEDQVVFIAIYVMLFFVFHELYVVSRIVIVMMLVINLLLCAAGRLMYKNYSIKHNGG